VTQTTKGVDALTSLLLPALLLSALIGVIILQTGLLEIPHRYAAAAAPQTVRIQPRAYSYRSGGEYLQDGIPVDGPLVDVASPPPLDIMKFEVSTVEYARCFAAGACRAAEPRGPSRDGLPVTGVSFDDAQAYAAWLSEATGEPWRLPTLEEWVFAAGSQAADPALLRRTDATNPANRWLASYRQSASATAGGASALPQPAGAFGENAFGIADMTGTVWEWTATCNTRTLLDASGRVESMLESCGIRLLEGGHRTPMSAFMRDGRGGGCGMGLPTYNLGFRLVRSGPSQT
jgi:formylglycine-generating enzyme required for sulfatase activity